MKKKAFTLTELLVVVVIIGVLSAVVLPKFTKVLETRKTTEAEEMMTAIRNEQEARCTISKNYTDINKIHAYKDSSVSPNFTYENNAEGVGMIATAKGKNYQLEIPSYVDGRICCSGNYCDELNKSYPKCNELTDLVPGNQECSVPLADEEEPEEEPCTLTEQDLTCQAAGYPEGYTGHVLKKVNASCAYYTAEDTCKAPEQPKGCDEKDKPKPQTQDCVLPEDKNIYPQRFCGEKTREAECNESTGYEWKFPVHITDGWSECVKVEGKCDDESSDHICDATDYFELKSGETVGPWEICEEAGMILNEDHLQSVIPEDATKQSIKELCCSACTGDTPNYVEMGDGTGGACCAEGETEAYWDFKNKKPVCCSAGQQLVKDSHGTYSCGSCSDLGPNYYFDGSKCTRRYTMEKATFALVKGEVYRNFVPSGNPCSLDFSGKTVSACAFSGKGSNKTTVKPGGDDPDALCDQCNADSAECNVVACYDIVEYEQIASSIKKQSNSEYHIDVGGKGTSGNKCEGSLWYDKDAWYDLVGVHANGDVQLCGISNNGVWLSDAVGASAIAYCSECGGKSRTVALHNATFMPTQQGGNCQTFYTEGDIDSWTDVEAEAELDFWKKFNSSTYWQTYNDPNYVRDIPWEEIAEQVQQRSDAALYEGYLKNVIKHTGSEGTDGLYFLENYDWSKYYTEEQFAALFGIQPSPQEGLQWGANYMQWYTMQKYYYKNDIAFDPKLAASNDVTVIYQNTSDGYDNWTWQNYVQWMNRRTAEANERVHNTNGGCLSSGSTITACATPKIMEIGGYACRRKK